MLTLIKATVKTAAIARVGIVLSMGLLMTGCVSVPGQDFTEFTPVQPIRMKPPAANGTIFQAGYDMAIFEDNRARNIGDIVTVLLAEQTSGTKSTDTSIAKDSNTTIAEPTLNGRTDNIGFGGTLGSSHDFGGSSDSSQSNQLSGSITVMIADILPGGNLVVQGEKWIQINQGREYIRLQGIVRPIDISAENTLLSTQIADAKISYGGKGALANANTAGWVTKFFLSPVWPF